MGVLSASTLAAIKAANEAVMPDVCEIVRMTATQSATGAYSDTASTVIASGVPGRLREVGHGGDAIANGALTVEATAVLSLPLGTDVQQDDVVTVAGITYQVLLVHAVRGYSSAQVVDLARAVLP